jgi:hypothetical protein
MNGSDVYESLVEEVCTLNRVDMIAQLAHFPGNLRLDFSKDFLHSCDTDYLRHLLLAALWRCHMKAMAC